MKHASDPEDPIQQDLNRRQVMLAALIDSSEDAIISKTLQGVITSWNQAAQHLFGYVESEVIGKHISLLIPPDRLQEEEMIIDRISKGQRVQHFQTLRLTKSGRLIPISLTISPIRTADGVIIGASKIARDISEQLRAQEEIARLYEEVKALNARKDEFIGVAGHELRTPITTIKGYLQLLEDQAGTGDVKDFLTKALRQVNRLNRLVGDLLDVTRIQSGKLEYKMIACRLLPLIKESVETVRQIHTSHSIDLALPTEDLIITADGSKIEQVLINLLINAVKYSPEGSKIILTVKKDGNQAVVSIKDQGIGIPSQHLVSIFDRYYRIDHGAAVGGLGIGLYISKEIIDRHGGSIWAESREGEGSIFYFSLPLPE